MLAEDGRRYMVVISISIAYPYDSFLFWLLSAMLRRWRVDLPLMQAGHLGAPRPSALDCPPRPERGHNWHPNFGAKVLRFRNVLCSFPFFRPR